MPGAVIVAVARSEIVWLTPTPSTSDSFSHREWRARSLYFDQSPSADIVLDALAD
jgi:hypothetical protein